MSYRNDRQQPNFEASPVTFLPLYSLVSSRVSATDALKHQSDAFPRLKILQTPSHQEMTKFLTRCNVHSSPAPPNPSPCGVTSWTRAPRLLQPLRPRRGPSSAASKRRSSAFSPALPAASVRPTPRDTSGRFCSNGTSEGLPTRRTAAERAAGEAPRERQARLHGRAGQELSPGPDTPSGGRSVAEGLRGTRRAPTLGRSASRAGGTAASRRGLRPRAAPALGSRRVALGRPEDRGSMVSCARRALCGPSWVFFHF